MTETKAKIFTRDVYIVTEWRDGCVWRTKKVGQVMTWMDPKQWPFKPGSKAQAVPVS